MLYQKPEKSLSKISLTRMTLSLSLSVKDHRIIQRTRIISISKLRAKKLYSSLPSNVQNKPSQINLEKIFANKLIKLNEIYLLSREVHVTHIYDAFSKQY